VAVGTALLLLVLVEFGRPYIPPAPLRVVAAQFGGDYQTETKSVEPVLTEVEPGQARRLHVITPIKAPLGPKNCAAPLHKRHSTASPFIQVTGGREQGFVDELSLRSYRDWRQSVDAQPAYN
jgi:hypothetical protein